MIVKLTDRDILTLGMNLILGISVASYLMLSCIATFSLSMAETAYPMQEGLIYILYTFAAIAIQTAIVITLMFDIWIFYIAWKEQHRDTL